MVKLFDKFFDGALVFIGVFFAFFFNQCQQDKLLKEELNFNLSQIFRELPKEKPAGEIENFVLKQEVGEDGLCSIVTGRNLYKTYSGSKHLDVILNRGLGSYLSDADKPVIKQASIFYDLFLMRSREGLDEYNRQVEKVTSRVVNAEKCLSKVAFNKLRKSLIPSYTRYQKARVIAELVGYNLYTKLDKMGLEPGKTQVMDIDFNFSIKDWEEN